MRKKYMYMINIYDFKDWNIQTKTKSEHIKMILSKTEHQIWFLHLNWNKFKLKQTYKQIYFHPSILIETNLQTNHIWSIHLKTEQTESNKSKFTKFYELEIEALPSPTESFVFTEDSSVAVEESSVATIHRIDEKERELCFHQERELHRHRHT